MKTHKKTDFLRVLAPAILALWTVAGYAAGLDQTSINSCKECHSKQAESFFAGNPHAKIWNHDKTAQSALSCESCHGSGQTHMKSREAADIIGFGKDAKATAAAQSKQCLTCHEKSQTLSMWDLSAHKKNDVSCASCHKMHQGGLTVRPTFETCFGCHKDVKQALNKNSHHPVIEGKVSCYDCHNPHGSPNPHMIRAESNNQLCYKCHADKRGPFLWEHPPVEENCMTCHTPHGSQHDKMLVARPATGLCNNCHNGHSSPYGAGNSFGGGTNLKAQDLGRQCLNCHARIHGTNAPGNTNNHYTSGKYFLR